jgi:hypothetical protein
MQSFSIVGPRRIGKSSLLFYIASRYAQYLGPSSKYRFAYIDLQDASTLTPDGLFKKILSELGAPPQTNAKLTLAKFQDAITALKEGGALPVILLDEFEELLHHAGLIAPDLFDSWRYLMNNNVAAFITASKTPLNELAKAKKFTSPFFNIFTFMPLGNFTDDEALELINRCNACTPPFENVERNLMHTLAGNHPYKLQLAGSLIYDMKAREGKVDWDKLRAAFDRQVNAVGLDDNIVTKTVLERWLNAVKWGFIEFPKIFGRAILESLLRLNRDSFSETTAWIVGAVPLAVLVLILLGYITVNLEDILKLIDRLRGK